MFSLIIVIECLVNKLFAYLIDGLARQTVVICNMSLNLLTEKIIFKREIVSQYHGWRLQKLSSNLLSCETEFKSSDASVSVIRYMSRSSTPMAISILDTKPSYLSLTYRNSFAMAFFMRFSDYTESRESSDRFVSVSSCLFLT